MDEQTLRFALAGIRAGVKSLARQRNEAEVERDELAASVARVEALHVVDPTIVDEYAYCRECSGVWPCDTTKALRGEDQ